MLVPTCYRRRSGVLWAVRITAGNYEQVADWCGGARIAWLDGDPALYLGHSVVPARIGDYAVRDEHADGWLRCFPMKARALETAYEQVCRHCRPAPPN